MRLCREMPAALVKCKATRPACQGSWLAFRTRTQPSLGKAIARPQPSARVRVGLVPVPELQNTSAGYWCSCCTVTESNEAVSQLNLCEMTEITLQKCSPVL